MKKLKRALMLATAIASASVVGNEISQPHLPSQRIIALTPHSVEMLYEIGAGERIVGTVSYADYPEQAKAIPRIGQHNHIDFEQLLLLEPDLIVLGESAMAKPLLEQVKNLGIRVINSGVTRIDEVPERLTQLGEVVGTVSQANHAAAEFRAKLSTLRQQYRQRAPISVFWQLHPQPLITSANGWQSQMITDCGGRNVFDGASANYPQVSIEQVLVRQPEIIIRPYHGGIDLKLFDWQSWPEIPAVATQQIVDINGDLVNRPGPRVLQGLQTLCEAIDQSRMARAKINNDEKI